MGISSQNNPLHLILIKRLVIAACLIILCLSTYVFLTQKQEIRKAILERTQQGAVHFNAYLSPLLDAPGELDKVAIKRAIDEYTSRSLEQKHGRYVYLRLIDEAGGLVADVSIGDYPLINEVQKYLAANVISHKDGDLDENAYQIIIQDKPHVRILLPLDSGINGPTIYADLVFAISDSLVSTVYGKLITTILFISGIIIVTTLILYPVIFRLMKSLSLLSLDLLEANIDTLNVLGNAIAKRDSDTDAHNYRVTIISVRLAEELGLPPEDMRRLIKGAFLHDVGKIGIPDHILLKPGRLTEEEFEIMRTHVEHGLDIVRSSKWLNEASEVAGGHHEKFDGNGYPAGRKGEDVPVVARIFAITDVFDALLSKRPYKEPKPYEQVVEILKEGSGTHFDPQMLDAFLPISRQLAEDLANMENTALKEALSKILEKYFFNELISML